MKRFSLPKKKRLTDNRQFKAVMACRLHVSNGLLRLFVAENKCGYSRLGISVSKSCGGAVVRNRLKRLLREAFRQSQEQIPAGFDYVIMVPGRSSKLNKSAGPEEIISRLTLEQVSSSLTALAADAVKKVG